MSAALPTPPGSGASDEGDQQSSPLPVQRRRGKRSSSEGTTSSVTPVPKRRSRGSKDSATNNEQDIRKFFMPTPKKSEKKDNMISGIPTPSPEKMDNNPMVAVNGTTKALSIVALDDAGKADEQVPATSTKKSDVGASHPKGKGDNFEVEKLIDFWIQNGVGFYLVKWRGWEDKHNTWEPNENLDNCNIALTKFYLYRIDEIILAKRTFIKAGGKLRDTLKQLPLPEDPRPLDEQLHYFVEKYTDYVSLLAALKTVGKNIHIQNIDNERWPSIKLKKFLRMASTADLEESTLNALHSHVIKLVPRMKEEKLKKTLKVWEASLNEITNGMPRITVENNVDDVGPPLDFIYINTYLAGKGVFIPDDPIYGCDCEDSCTSSKKQCSKGHMDMQRAYNAKKRLTCEPGTPVYECNKRCKCGPDCVNRVVQNGFSPLKNIHYCIYRTANNIGWGVKTLTPIKKGVFVALYAGEIITSEQAERRGRNYDRHGVTYLFDLDFNMGEDCPYTVDAKQYGNISHFMNHSCDPNLTVYNVWADCVDPNLPLLALFASRDIQKNEDLTFNYMKNKDYKGMQTVGAKTECKCGSSNCMKVLF